jgi:hypothetical protein
MLKKIGLKFLVLVLIGVTAATDLLAQSRIRFARGRTSATVSGTMAAGGARDYVLGARRGQTLTATLSCGNGKCDFAQGDLHDTQYSQYVDSNGDVYITIHNHGRQATRFTMTVSIQ